MGGPWLHAYRYLEGRPAYVLLRGNVASELEPDVIVVAIDMDGVTAIDA